MTVYDSSAARQAAVLRARAQGRLWRRVLAWLGFPVTDARMEREAAAWAAGAQGEAATKAFLAPLEAYGWRVLHDRRIPGAHSANADHVIVSPGGRVYLVDSKLWSKKTGAVRLEGGRLMHGPYDRSRVLRALLFEQTLIERALGMPVTVLMAVHSAPVAAVSGAGFQVEGVSVIPAAALVRLLVLNDGPRHPGAAELGRAVEALLPPYL